MKIFRKFANSIILLNLLTGCTSGLISTTATLDSPTSMPLATQTTMSFSNSSSDTTGSDSKRIAISVENVDQINILATFSGHASRVKAVGFASDNSLLASSSSDGIVKIWNMIDLQEVNSYNQETNEEITFLENNELLSADTGYIWDINSGDTIYRPNLGNSRFTYSPDTHRMATTSINSPIEIWNTETWKIEKSFGNVVDPLIGFSFSSDGNLLAGGPGMGPDDVSDYAVRIWNVAEGIEIQTLMGHTADVHAVAFSPDTMLLASGSIDQTARIWDVNSGELIMILRHSDGLMDLKFSPDGKLLASAVANGDVKIWNVESGTLLKTLSHPDELTSVAFSNNGQFIAVGCYDSLVYLWGITE